MLIESAKQEVRACNAISERFGQTLSEEEINTFLSLNLTDSEMKIIPGEWVKGETRDEYYVNEELKRMVIEDFYVNK